MNFTKQARVVDPRQMARLSPEIPYFPALCPSLIHNQVVNSGEWRLYGESIECYSTDFDLLQWWETMAPRLPIIYPYAHRTLSIPHNVLRC